MRIVTKTSEQRHSGSLPVLGRSQLPVSSSTRAGDKNGLRALESLPKPYSRLLLNKDCLNTFINMPILINALVATMVVENEGQ